MTISSVTMSHKYTPTRTAHTSTRTATSRTHRNTPSRTAISLSVDPGYSLYESHTLADDHNKGTTRTFTETHRNTAEEHEITSTSVEPAQKQKLVSDDDMLLFRVGTYTGVAAAAVAPGSMTSGKVQQSLQMFGAMMCNTSSSFDDADEQNLTGLQIGTTRVKAYIGSVIAAISISIGILVLYKLIDFSFHYSRGTAETFPAFSLLPITFFFQPIVFCSMRCVYFPGEDNTAILVGGFGIVLATTVVAALFSYRHHGVKVRYQVLFNRYSEKFYYFASVEFAWMEVFAIVCAYATDVTFMCQLQMIFILSMYVVHIAIVLIVRPFRSRSEYLTTLLMDCANLIGTIIFMDDPAHAPWVVLLLLIAGFLSIFITMVVAWPDVAHNWKLATNNLEFFSMLPWYGRIMMDRDAHMGDMHELHLAGASADCLSDDNEEVRKMVSEMMEIEMGRNRGGRPNMSP